MKKFKICFYMLSSFLFFVHNVLCSLQRYDVNPEDSQDYIYKNLKIQGDLSNFADEKVMVAYRSVHFLDNIFSSQQRSDFLKTTHVNQTMFCSEVYKSMGLPYGYTERPSVLVGRAEEIADKVNGLQKKGPFNIIKNKKNQCRFENQRYAFQELYTNECQGFQNALQNPSKDYQPIFKHLNFQANPMLSFSECVLHGAKYGYGLKNFGSNQTLSPDYDVLGRPKHPFLGKLYAIVLDEAAVEQLRPFNVPEAHKAGKIKIKTHYTNNILSEREISIAGYVPEEYVVFEMPLQVPSFHHNTMPSYYKQKYGLTDLRYKNNKKNLEKPGFKNKTTQKIISNVIQADYQDNNMIYKNTLSYKVEDLLFRKLSKINASISTLMLDYTLEKKDSRRKI